MACQHLYPFYLDKDTFWLIYNQILQTITVVQNNQAVQSGHTCLDYQIENCFFVDGLGGAGKTFLYNTLLSSVRANNRIALAVASSGIAAFLLEGG